MYDILTYDMTQTMSIRDSSADVAASVKHVFLKIFLKNETQNTHCISASVKLGQFWRTSMVIDFFFSSALIKAFTFQFLSACFLPFLCKYLFPFLSRFIWRQSFTLLFFWQRCQSHKSNGMIGKSVAVTPNQFGVQLFTQLFHTPRTDLGLLHGHGSAL